MVLDIGLLIFCHISIFSIFTGTDIKQIRKEMIPVLVPPSMAMSESSSPVVSLTRKLYDEKFTLLHTLHEEEENPELTCDILDTGVSTNVSNGSNLSNPVSDDQRTPVSLT